GRCLTPAGDVPQMDRAVNAAGCQQLAIRRKGDRQHGSSVSLENVPHGWRFARGDAPEPDRVIETAGRQQPAVGGEGDGTDDVLVASEGPQQGAATSSPESDGAIGTGGRQVLVIGGKGNAADPAVVPLEGGGLAPLGGGDSRQTQDKQPDPASTQLGH